MMKSWSRLCLLVAAVSSVSRGHNETTVSPGPVSDTGRPVVHTTPPPPPPPLDETQKEAAVSATPSTLSPPSNTSANATDLTSAASTTPREETTSTEDSFQVNGSVPVGGKDGGNVDVTTVSTATAGTSSKPGAAGGSGASSWGYVILVLIILVIVVLCIILYFLRRVSRTYSFDLHRQVPANHLNEPIGTFEPVYLDDLDRPAPKDQATTDDLSPPPVSNGTTLQAEERGSSGENAAQEQPDANGLETSPTSNSSPSLGNDDPPDKTSSPLSISNLFFDVLGEEQQNENNNNPSVCSSDPFVEINLDEPAWCAQLLTSPEAPSSVLPFTPFSFSSSSSSSSS